MKLSALGDDAGFPDPSELGIDPSDPAGIGTIPSDGSGDFQDTQGGVGTTTPTGGMDYNSVINQGVALYNSLINSGGTQTAIPGGAVSPASYPSAAPAPAPTDGDPQSPSTTPGGFFNPATCPTGFCYQDLYDFSLPYPYLIGAALIGLVLLFTAKPAKAG